MDYRKLIIELLFRANAQQLQLLYKLIKAYITDEPNEANEAKKAA